MKTAYLTRTETSIEGTFGVLIIEDQKFFTAELPWRDNRPSISCIPVGNYRCKYGLSPKFRRYFYSVLNVPDRLGVLIHDGNFAGDVYRGFRSNVQGCILLGEEKGKLRNQKAVLKSDDAIKRFEAILNREEFMLVITETYPDDEERLAA